MSFLTLTSFPPALLVACSVGVAMAADGELVWSNPLPLRYVEGQTAPRTEIRDPCILREGDTYHLTFTMWPFRGRDERFLKEPNQGGSPGIAMYTSRDLLCIDPFDVAADGTIQCHGPSIGAQSVRLPRP